MTPKVKSLLYFVCFIVSILAYQVTSNSDTANNTDTAQLAPMHSQDIVVE